MYINLNNTVRILNEAHKNKTGKVINIDNNDPTLVEQFRVNEIELAEV